MIYGLYLSATGVAARSHEQDAIANNLANVETTGFKRQLALFQERSPTHPRNFNDPDLALIGGGQFISPSSFDFSQGILDRTDHNLDIALNDDNFLATRDPAGQIRYTRNGALMLNPEGFLVMGTQQGHRVLDIDQQPIQIPGALAGDVQISREGQISLRDGEPVAQLGLFQVQDPHRLRPVGGTLFKPDVGQQIALNPNASVEVGYLENSNVDPTIELVKLIEIQRQLEANANMIRYQDQTLGRAVNDVGRIG